MTKKKKKKVKKARCARCQKLKTHYALDAVTRKYVICFDCIDEMDDDPDEEGYAVQLL